MYNLLCGFGDLGFQQAGKHLSPMCVRCSLGNMATPTCGASVQSARRARVVFWEARRVRAVFWEARVSLSFGGIRADGVAAICSELCRHEYRPARERPAREARRGGERGPERRTDVSTAATGCLPRQVAQYIMRGGLRSAEHWTEGYHSGCNTMLKYYL